MINKKHSVSIIVNGEQVDIYSQEKLNLRINNVVFDPVSISTRTGEYSFSFELPATAKNNRIFNYANNSAKLNKFNTKYNCEVISDGVTIFNGILRLTDTQTDNYKCNLVNIKVYNVNEIFGDMVMSDLDWQVEFNGTSTINTVNNFIDSGYYFPLACYGAFQKEPKASYNGEINEYTDLLQIDSYNKWYWESFHPSLNLLEVVKRLFQQKGYNVSGNIFNDEAMKRIYMSEYIDAQQDPFYNLNKSEIGDLHIAGTYNNNGNTSGTTTYGPSSGRARVFNRPPISTYQDLTFPKEKVTEDVYQFDRIAIFDVLATPTGGSYHNFSVPPTNTYLYRQNNPYNTSGFIYIPATGLYTIQLTVTGVSISEAIDGMTYQEKYYNTSERDIDTREKAVGHNFKDMPVEIPLVRNSTETELIGDIDEVNGLMYPHEMDYTKYKITQRTTQTTPTTTSSSSSSTSSSTSSGRTRTRTPSTGSGTTSSYSSSTDRSGGRVTSVATRERATTTYIIPDTVYYTKKHRTIAYDPFANPNFICGFTTMNESPAVIKNGVSWNASVSDFNQSHFVCTGYVERDSSGNETSSDYNKNSLVCLSPDYFSSRGTYEMEGRVTCVVELKKNDILFLEMVTRLYEDVTFPSPLGAGTISMSQSTYNCKFNYDIKVTPYTDKTDQYINVQNLYYLPNQEVKDGGWGQKLKLGNFLNNNEKVSDFINNFIKSFNLEYSQDGNNIILNKAKKVIVPLNYVDLDDRVNTEDIVFQRIDYPNSMQVKWAIDEEEAGAYRSIPTVQQQGSPNWKDYIDRGSEKIVMDTNNESVDTSIDSKFSYCWYQDFTYKDFNRQTLEDNGEVETFRLPLITKDENFIIQNDDAMKKDGLSLKQRLWFRDQKIDQTLMLWNGEEAVVSIPTDTYMDYVLNYKQQIGSMVDRYFNILPMTDSNFALVDVYITPFEYNMIKNGAMVRVDNDLYIVSEIQGYDCTGNNLTNLKLIKVV